jgi:hypothetical protein
MRGSIFWYLIDNNEGVDNPYFAGTAGINDVCKGKGIITFKY